MSYFSLFQSTHPARGGTPYWCVLARPAFHFNPRTPRGVRPGGGCGAHQDGGISIHAPREGCDDQNLNGSSQCQISIHAPREGCDQDIHPLLRDMYISIHAPREGCDEVQPWMFGHPVQFQSTHPARGATAPLLPPKQSPTPISIHAPREGCDTGRAAGMPQHAISIHAPREGCDKQGGFSISTGENFNPRTPRGVRPWMSIVHMAQP